jgi:peptidoglycan/xylan/chitin deacetylase (PgdA/CDA1 family)
MRVSGLITLARRLSSGGVILCYHNVVAGTDAGASDKLGLHMPLPTFARQMRWLAHNYEVVPLAEFVVRWLRGASLRGAAAVTFDDAYGGVFDHAWPLLRDLGLSATVFVVADAPGRDEGFWWDDPDVLRAYSPARRQHWLTSSQGDGRRIVDAVAPARRPWQAPAWCRPATWHAITEGARSGLQLGVHSATHRSLPALSERDLQREVAESRDVIRRQTGVAPEFFAYPYGLWNTRVRRAVRVAGYRAAFTLEEGHVGAKADAWTLPRVNVPASIEDAAFEAWTAGLNLRRALPPLMQTSAFRPDPLFETVEIADLETPMARERA